MFLTDENIPPKIIEFLRKKGYDVADVRERNLSRIPDTDLVEIAKKENRILLTFDKHFSNIFIYPPKDYSGIIRIRIHPPLLSIIESSLERLLSSFSLSDFKGSLVILEKDDYRIYR